MTETEFDKILFQALRENANENNRKLLEGYSDKNIHIFSESFNRKMYHDLKKYGINPKGIIKIKHGISYNKAFISVASAVFILFSVSVAVPEVRAVVWGSVIEWLENNIAIYFGDTGNSSIESAVYPKYIPEGYDKQADNSATYNVTETVDGKDTIVKKTGVVVPKLKFDTIDKILTECHAKGLKLRGHTLLWHAQTPTYFFQKGFSVVNNKSKNTSEENMDLRLEYFVKNVMEQVAKKVHNQKRVLRVKVQVKSHK